MRIRAVNPADPATAALLEYLQRTCLPADTPADTDRGHWWVAFDGGLPVGFAALYPSARWRETGYLARAGVLRSHRGRGLQKRLIRVRERKARALNWRYLITDTYENPPSNNSLIACGYRTYTPSVRWGAEGVVYWRKRINLE